MTGYEKETYVLTCNRIDTNVHFLCAHAAEKWFDEKQKTGHRIRAGFWMKMLDETIWGLRSQLTGGQIYFR